MSRFTTCCGVSITPMDERSEVNQLKQHSLREGGQNGP